MRLCISVVYINFILLSQLAHTMDGQDLKAAEQNMCCSCLKEHAQRPKHCSGCKTITYCDQQCQKAHWSEHKKLCRHLADITDTKSEMPDITTLFSDDQVWHESFEVYAQAKNELSGLNLTRLEQDGYFDRLATKRAIAPACLYATLHYLKEHGLPQVNALLMPAIGFLSPLELKAIQECYHNPQIHGFDNNATMVKATRRANPAAAQHFVVADGFKVDTWKRFQNLNIDTIFILHPDSHKANLLSDTARLSWPVLPASAQYFPDTSIVVVTKSKAEQSGVYQEMLKLKFQNIEVINNTERSFPCMSCPDKLFTPINNFSLNPVLPGGYMVSDLIAIKNNNPDDVKNYLMDQGERRYHYIVTAKTPKQ